MRFYAVCPKCGKDYNNSKDSKLVQARLGYALFCKCGFVGYQKFKVTLEDK